MNISDRKVFSSGLENQKRTISEVDRLIYQIEKSINIPSAETGKRKLQG